MADRPDLLLADLHLPADTKASFLNEAFLRFCAGPARAAGRVFLLGDLFEHWVGDDVGLAAYSAEVAALRTLHDAGVTLHYQTGNRDFLLGRGFAAATGAEALDDEAVVTLADGTATLLAHGDAYCTDDRGYQRWRRFSRNRLAQAVFLRLPADTRQRIAGGVRRGSQDAKQHKPMQIMDVNAHAVDAALHRHPVKRLIHGHTHRPAEHECAHHGGRALRIVLADWRPDRIEWLRVTRDGWSRETLR